MLSWVFPALEFDLPPKDFSEHLCQAMDVSGIEKLKLDSSSREKFKDRIIRLLSGQLLGLSTKAGNILAQHENVFGYVRVSTDGRFLFDSDIEQSSTSAIIVHTLKIHYIQGHEHKDLFIPLNAEDLDGMISLLKHAKDKENALKTTLRSTNVPYIDA